MKYLMLALLFLGGCASGVGGQEFTADTVGSIETTHTIINQQFTTKQLIAYSLIVGWAIPGPIECLRLFFGGLGEMFKGIFSLFRMFRG